MTVASCRNLAEVCGRDDTTKTQLDRTLRFMIFEIKLFSCEISSNESKKKAISLPSFYKIWSLHATMFTVAVLGRQFSLQKY